MPDDSESVKIKKDVKKQIDGYRERTGLTHSEIIGISLSGLDVKCITCEKPFIEHAFIFSHQFKAKK